MFSWALAGVLSYILFELIIKTFATLSRFSRTKSLPIESVKPSTFWNTYSVIHEIRQICIKYAATSIKSSILTTSEEVDLFSLLYPQFGLNNRYYKLHMIKTKLIYSATNESFRFDEFKSSCIGCQNILMLLRNNYGNVIGGYTSVGIMKPSWFEDGIRCHKDPSAFLCRVRSKDGLPPCIFVMGEENRYKQNAVGVIWSREKYAFTFGYFELALGIKGENKMGMGRAGSRLPFYGINPNEFSGGRLSMHISSLEFVVEQIEAHKIIL